MVKKKSIHRKRSSKKRVSRKRRSKKRSSKRRSSQKKRISKRRIRKKTQKGASFSGMRSVLDLRDAAAAAQNTTKQSDGAAPSSRITPTPHSVRRARRQMPFLRRAFAKIDDEIHPMHTDLFHRHLNLRDKVETLRDKVETLHDKVETLEERHVSTADAAAVHRAELDEKINTNSADLNLLGAHRVPPPPRRKSK